MYNTCLLLRAHSAAIMAGELYGLQQNKQVLSQVLSPPISVKEIAKRSHLPLEISSRKLLKIYVNNGDS